MSTSGWILVSERLPKEGDRILAAFRNCRGNLNVEDCEFLNGEFQFTIYPGKIRDVVKWMPIPDPNNISEKEKSAMGYNPQNVKHFGFAPHKMRKLYRQRIRHGFCDYDVCDMGCYLFCVLPKMLRQLATEGISYKQDYEAFNTLEDWRQYLLDTARSFGVLRNRIEGKYDDEPTPEQHQKEVDDAFAKLAHVFYDLWD